MRKISVMAIVALLFIGSPFIVPNNNVQADNIIISPDSQYIPRNVVVSVSDMFVHFQWDPPSNTSTIYGYIMLIEHLFPDGSSYPLEMNVGANWTDPGIPADQLQKVNYDYSWPVFPEGTIYTFYLQSIYIEGPNDALKSEPVKIFGPIALSSPYSINFFTETNSGTVGFSERIFGSVWNDEKNSGATGSRVDFSYSINGGSTWNEITSITTDQDGSFDIQWLPTATGSYLVKGVVFNEGRVVHEKTISLVVLNSNNNYFSVQSTSSLTDLTFNSTSKELSFKVSGDSGTEGQTRISINKDLVKQGSEIVLSMDGTQVNYNLTQTQDSWILSFTYHHSSHDVTADLSAASEAGSANPLSSLTSFDVALIIIVGLMAIIVVLAIALIKSRKKGKE